MAQPPSWFACLLLLLVATGGAGLGAAPRLELKTGDVVAFVGGANMAAAAESGHLEAILSARFPGRQIRYRNLAWEADTVHAQPRDFNFPGLTNLLSRFEARVVFIAFGQAESLEGESRLGAFRESLARLAGGIATGGREVLLVTPVPFETPGGVMRDLRPLNSSLARYAEAIADLGRERAWRVVDLFTRLRQRPPGAASLTSDGMHLTPRGEAVAARVFAQELGWDPVDAGFSEPSEGGVWTDPRWEGLRQAVVAKNRLWFDYWRPMNWAFLGGDRTEQPSSRDHRDPKIRWFPAEMERFQPLIYSAEARIDSLAGALATPPTP